MPKGYLDTTHIDFPIGLDEAYVRGLETPRGVSFERVLALIDERLRAASTIVDPLVAALAYFTTQAAIAIDSPTLFELEEEAEYVLTRPDLAEPVRGWLLPFRRYQKAMGFTEQGLEETTEAEIIRQIDSFLATFIRARSLKVLRRLFSAGEEYVDRTTTATSPGFAGSGTGDNAFVTPYPDGTALPGGYTHYYRDTAANRATMISTMRDQLARWNPGPFDLFGSATEIAAISALGEAGGFTKATSDLILRAQGVAAANVDAVRYVGVFGDDVRVWHGRLELGSEPNFAVFKSYGDLNPRNPIAIRYDETFGRGIDLQYRSLYPLENSFMRQRYGVGAGDRVGAALARVDDAGGYVAPTIL